MDPQPPEKKKPPRSYYGVSESPDHAFWGEKPVDFETRMKEKYGPNIFVKKPSQSQRAEWGANLHKILALRDYHFRRTGALLKSQRKRVKKTGIVPEKSIVGDHDLDRRMVDHLKEPPYNIDLSDHPDLELRRRELFVRAEKDELKHGKAVVLDGIRKYIDPARPETADMTRMTDSQYGIRRRRRVAIDEFKQLLNTAIAHDPVLKERAEEAIRKGTIGIAAPIAKIPEAETPELSHALFLKELAKEKQMKDDMFKKIMGQSSASAAQPGPSTESTRVPIADVSSYSAAAHMPSLRPPAPSSEPMPQSKPKSTAPPTYDPFTYEDDDFLAADPDNLLRSIPDHEYRDYGFDPESHNYDFDHKI